MCAKTWMLVTSNGSAHETLADNPELDREAAQDFAVKLFPNEDFVPLDDGNLYFANPPDNELYVGCFGGVEIIAAREFGNDYPFKLPSSFFSDTGLTTLHAMHSVVDWFAFSHWLDGNLVRALSLSPDSGVLEDVGERLAFEEPNWAGKFPAVDNDADDYTFAFHPLELGEATLKHFFGYQIEGYVGENLFDPESYPLMHFKRVRSRSATPWWKF